MRVYVIRHGESEYNIRNLRSGWADVQLTEKGITDAEKAGKFLEGISFDKVYSSDLQRAINTMKTAINPDKYEINEILRERNFGSLEGTRFADSSDEDIKYMREFGYDKWDGETHAVFRERVKRFITEKLETLDYENVAVFSHAGWLREMLGIVLDTDISARQICCNNCTISIYEYINNNWRLHSWINL